MFTLALSFHPSRPLYKLSGDVRTGNRWNKSTFAEMGISNVHRLYTYKKTKFQHRLPFHLALWVQFSNSTMQAWSWACMSAQFLSEASFSLLGIAGGYVAGIARFVYDIQIASIRTLKSKLFLYFVANFPMVYDCSLREIPGSRRSGDSCQGSRSLPQGPQMYFAFSV